MQETIAEFTTWLASVSTIDTQGNKAIFSPIDYISSNCDYVIASNDDAAYIHTLKTSPEHTKLKLRADDVTEESTAKLVLRSAKSVELNYFVVPASNNGDE